MDGERKGGALGTVPAELEPLERAVGVDARAAEAGYDWPDAEGARGKVDEELRELDRALEDGDAEGAERELGDVLLALVSFARKRGLDPRRALGGALSRFSARFGWAERRAAERGERLEDLSPEQLDALWNEAKRALGGPQGRR